MFAKALVVDDESDICQLLKITLNRMSIEADTVDCLNEAKNLLIQNPYSLCIADMRLPDGNGLDLIEYIQEKQLNLPIAIISAHGNMDVAIKALKLGAFDFISKPIDLTNLRTIISSAIKLNQPTRVVSSKNLLGESAIMQDLRNKISRLARSQAPVYISGPSGSGKELVARLIHQSGPRQHEPFIPVNCGAIPSELMESEFFGFIKGSFTGANQDKVGFFQAANKGTLFLDEVADLPLDMQVKLLRAIQEKKIRPVGSLKEIYVDVRILCATHKDLAQLVKKNLFREDLFYRINVIELAVPSLSERKEDIPVIAQHILRKMANALGKNPLTLEKDAIAKLQSYDFPGNIRELENILERAQILSDGTRISASDLKISTPQKKPLSYDNDPLPLDKYLQQIEKSIIEETLQKHHHNQTQTAKALKISLRKLRYRMDKLDIQETNEPQDEI